MRVRRLAKPNSGSTATVRAGSRPSSSALVVASAPSGATKHTASGVGFSSGRAPRSTINSFNSGTAHTAFGLAPGAGASGVRRAALFLSYSYQPRLVFLPSKPAATRGSARNEGRYFGSSKYC